eukprot:365156-Chlamydomonas_euryale.AAC.4
MHARTHTYAPHTHRLLHVHLLPEGRHRAAHRGGRCDVVHVLVSASRALRRCKRRLPSAAVQLLTEHARLEAAGKRLRPGERLCGWGDRVWGGGCGTENIGCR